MNNKKLKSVVLAVVLLLSCAFLFACTYTGVLYKGAVLERTPQELYLKFNYMDGTDSHTLSLKSGDVLSVHFEKEEGDFSVIIGIKGEDYIYKTDDGGNMDFKLNVEKTGNYEIVINSKKAKGVIAVKRINS